MLHTPVPVNKKEFFVHSATRNAPYIHPSHDSILELWRTFPNGLWCEEYNNQLYMRLWPWSQRSMSNIFVIGQYLFNSLECGPAFSFHVEHYDYWGHGRGVPVSHIPLIVLKNIPNLNMTNIPKIQKALYPHIAKIDPSIPYTFKYL